MFIRGKCTLCQVPYGNRSHELLSLPCRHQICSKSVTGNPFKCFQCDQVYYPSERVNGEQGLVYILCFNHGKIASRRCLTHGTAVCDDCERESHFACEVCPVSQILQMLSDKEMGSFHISCHRHPDLLSIKLCQTHRIAFCQTCAFDHDGSCNTIDLAGESVFTQIKELANQLKSTTADVDSSVKSQLRLYEATAYSDLCKAIYAVMDKEKSNWPLMKPLPESLCPVCRLSFTNEHFPYQLYCDHRVCGTFYHDYVKTNGLYKCIECGEEESSQFNYIEDHRILCRIEELQCTDHYYKRAVSLCMDHAKALCFSCLFPHKTCRRQDLPNDYVKEEIIENCLEIAALRRVLPENLSSKDSFQRVVSAWKDMNEIKVCNQHKVPADFFHLTQLRLACDQCTGKTRHLREVTENETLKQCVKKHLCMIPFFQIESPATCLQVTSDLSKSELLAFAYQVGRLNPSWTDHPCLTCPNCLKPSSELRKLRCKPGPHVLCQDCGAEETITCPIDGNTFAWNLMEAEPFIPKPNDLEMLECWLCDRAVFNEKDHKPVSLKCGHLVCSKFKFSEDESFCPICDENRGLSQIASNESRRIEEILIALRVDCSTREHCSASYYCKPHNEMLCNNCLPIHLREWNENLEQDILDIFRVDIIGIIHKELGEVSVPQDKLGARDTAISSKSLKECFDTLKLLLNDAIMCEVHKTPSNKHFNLSKRKYACAECMRTNRTNEIILISGKQAEEKLRNELNKAMREVAIQNLPQKYLHGFKSVNTPEQIIEYLLRAKDFRNVQEPSKKIICSNCCHEKLNFFHLTCGRPHALCSECSAPVLNSKTAAIMEKFCPLDQTPFDPLRCQSFVNPCYHWDERPPIDPARYNNWEEFKNVPNVDGTRLPFPTLRNVSAASHFFETVPLMETEDWNLFDERLQPLLIKKEGNIEAIAIRFENGPVNLLGISLGRPVKKDEKYLVDGAEIREGLSLKGAIKSKILKDYTEVEGKEHSCVIDFETQPVKLEAMQYYTLVLRVKSSDTPVVSVYGGNMLKAPTQVLVPEPEAVDIPADPEHFPHIFASNWWTFDPVQGLESRLVLRIFYRTLPNP